MLANFVDKSTPRDGGAGVMELKAAKLLNCLATNDGMIIDHNSFVFHAFCNGTQ